MPNPISTLKILLIEDNPDDLFIFREYLILSGLPVDELLHASSLSAAIDQIRHRMPNLIIMDLNLQDSNGISTFSTINLLAPETPIIVLSGLNDLKAALKTIGLGAQDYLLKGEFDEKLLAKTIQYSLERKKNSLEENRKQALLLRKELDMQKTINNIIIQTQEKERKEIGLELHDNINQILASAYICISMLQKGEGDKYELLSISGTMVSKAIDEIRNLTKSLTPYTLQYIGLEEAMLELIGTMPKNGNLRISLRNFNKEIEHISSCRKLNLYRITQEQLNNILKHSGATEAEIHLWLENDTVGLTIMDNGIGFNSEEIVNGNGFYNISNRVEVHGGKVDIQSQPGNGVSLNITIPVI